MRMQKILDDNTNTELEALDAKFLLQHLRSEVDDVKEKLEQIDSSLLGVQNFLKISWWKRLFMNRKKKKKYLKEIDDLRLQIRELLDAV